MSMNILAGLSEKSITINRNELLKFEGSVDTNIYYVVNGSLRIYLLDELEEKTIRFGYTDNLIVSLDSFLTGKPSKYYIQALKRSTIRVITRSQFDEFLKIGNNTQWWTKILEGLVIQQLEREIDLLTNSPKERYDRVMNRSAKLFQEIPHRYIANYLRMSPETLSRLKKS